MQITTVVHMYPPHHNAGAEHMLHAMLSDLAKRGHDCRVHVPKSRGDIGNYALDGVWASSDSGVIQGSDVILTHLDKTPLAMSYAEHMRIPLVHIIHNQRQGEFALGKGASVYNSEWLKAAVKGEGVVVHPPVYPERYRVEPGDCVTLINCQHDKGAPLAYELAKLMPDVEFLFVQGAYGAQLTPPKLPNVSVMEQQEDARRIYERTRVLLVPSIHESYGRVAIEAAVSGIPVIAHGTEGLIEALGKHGVFPEAYTAKAWETALRTVLGSWTKHSARVRGACELVDSDSEMTRFEEELCRLAHRSR